MWLIGSICDFEDSALCGFTQDKNDSFNWTWKAGETTTSFTGPSADHTEGTATGMALWQKLTLTVFLLPPKYLKAMVFFSKTGR